MITFKKTCVLAAGGAALMLAGGGTAHAGAESNGSTAGSPGGFFSGNLVQHATHTQTNQCGKAESYGSFVNPAFGTNCGNFSSTH